MKKVLFTHKFLPGMKRVESHLGKKFSLKIVSYTIVWKKTCFSQLLKWEASYVTFNYYFITKYPKFELPLPLVCTCSILVAPSPLSSYVQNLRSAPPTTKTTFTTTSQKNSKFCDFIDFKNCPLNVPQVHRNTNGINYKG